MNKETYCRCCGKNKGHNFPTCPNLPAHKKIIQIQDDEIQGYLSRIKTLSETSVKQAEMIKNLEYTSKVLDTFINLYNKTL